MTVTIPNPSQSREVIPIFPITTIPIPSDSHSHPWLFSK